MLRGDFLYGFTARLFDTEGKKGVLLVAHYYFISASLPKV
jgi:hypothetical protein